MKFVSKHAKFATIIDKRKIRFDHGVFETTDPSIIDALRKNPDNGIRYTEVPDAIPQKTQQVSAPSPAAPAPVVGQPVKVTAKGN